MLKRPIALAYDNNVLRGMIYERGEWQTLLAPHDLSYSHSRDIRLTIDNPNSHLALSLPHIIIIPDYHDDAIIILSDTNGQPVTNLSVSGRNNE